MKGSRGADVDRGQAAFTRTGLALYDLLILRALCPWVWHNRADTRGRLVESLERHLRDVQVEQAGCVALFSGRV